MVKWEFIALNEDVLAHPSVARATSKIPAWVDWVAQDAPVDSFTKLTRTPVEAINLQRVTYTPEDGEAQVYLHCGVKTDKLTVGAFFSADGTVEIIDQAIIDSLAQHPTPDERLKALKGLLGLAPKEDKSHPPHQDVLAHFAKVGDVLNTLAGEKIPEQYIKQYLSEIKRIQDAVNRLTQINA